MAIDTQIFTQKLHALKAQTLKDIHAAKDSTKAVELDQTAIGRVSRIDAIQLQEMQLATEQRRHDQLQRIEAALQRIADESYGYCLNCGEAIPEKRLTFNPTVLNCVDCAT